MKLLRPLLELVKDPLVLLNAAAATVFLVIVATFFTVAGCAHDAKPAPATPAPMVSEARDAGAVTDAGVDEAADAGSDAGSASSVDPDAGLADAGSHDAGAADAGARTPDAGAADAGHPRGKTK